MFPHRNIRTYNWSSHDGKTENKIDHIMIDRRRYFSILDIRFIREIDCDTDHYAAFTSVRESVAVSKKAAQKFYVERINLRKLNDLEVRKEYQIKIPERSAALDNLNYREDISRAWENIKENMKSLAKGSLDLYELEQHKT